MLPFFLNMKQSKEKYADLLLSDKWMEKRIKVFKRDGYKCKHCGINKNLNCHPNKFAVHTKDYYRISVDQASRRVITLSARP
jgi:hypothetical protein